MSIVLVHGVPETDVIWDGLVQQLVALGHPEPVRLSPPGFGAPVPDGFAATWEAYRDWLVGELEAFDEPVDLVGHDWGGGHALNAVMARPDLVRTWVSDIVGIYDPGYTWHDLAQLWQTPEAGEAAVAKMTDPDLGARRADNLVAAGMEATTAARVASGMDAAMGECILRLYRSAQQPVLAELGSGLEVAATRPGLALLATDDHMVGTDEQRRSAAARAGARVEVLGGLGHWWMTHDPARGARVLSDFWAAGR